MLQILIFVSLILMLCYYLLTKNYNYFKSKGIPYDKPFLFFGSFFEVAVSKQHISERITEIYNEYKKYPYAGFFIFNKPTILINSPELLKKVLVKDFDKFADRDLAANEKADPLAFHSLFSSKGQNWKAIRNKISPVFTTGKMKLMMPLMQECAETFVTVLEKNDGQKLDFRFLTKKYAVDLISSCAFGINSHCLKDDNSDFFPLAVKLLDTTKFKRNFSLFCFFFIPKLVDILQLTFLDSEASDSLVKIFKNTLMERKNNNVVRHDLIDLLNTLKEKEKITDEYIFDDQKMAAQAIVFFSAGNETTSMTITYTLYELAFQKRIQSRLRDELRESYMANGGFTYESLQEMKYLGMVVNETLRKYPLTTFLSREAITDYVLDDGVKIDKGTSIVIPISGLHFDPVYFPDSEKYDPERFSDENKNNILQYTFMPFGEGPRNCIGQRFGLLATKVALCYLIKDFEVEITDETPIPLKFNPKAVFLEAEKKVILRVKRI